MTPTPELRAELRELIDEVIPPGGTEADTRFTDTQIDALLTAASDINEAAANGWTRKAARAMSERGGLEESQAGNEKLKFVSIKDYRDHCLAMAKMYRDMVPGKGSRLLAFDAPDVLGIGDTV
ncbi:MAG TPA: hypothetical protein PK728_11780 [Bacillota bacterium]|nr:hypothetical protein [Bacillota bacterium]